MFNKYGVNYTGAKGPVEEKEETKKPIVYERVDTTPEIYDDEEIPVAVPEKNFGLTLLLVFLDRCHSLLLPASATGGGRNRPLGLLRKIKHFSKASFQIPMKSLKY